MKVTPRVTIAQSSYNETPDESNDSFKEAGDMKSEKKVPNEQKADYSKLTHGISINLGNGSISNSCGGTQLPRIAEEKDSPTGTGKGDDYSSKEIGERCDKQSGSKEETHGDVVNRDNERQSVATSGDGGSSKMTQCNRKEENYPVQSGVSANVQQAHGGAAATASQKSSDQKHCQQGPGEKSSASLSHKVHVFEQKASGKGNVEAISHQDARKILKKHKVEPPDGTSAARSSTREGGGISSGKDKKSN